MDKYNNPIITVLMPVYNCALYIKEAIDSILIQSFEDFEFLIIDDASIDNTVSIIKSYNDHRIQLIEKPKNSGYTNSLNYGLSIAKGKYIARMDGDDISLPERFSKQYDFMEANEEVVVCGSSFSNIGENLHHILPQWHDDIKINLLRNNTIVHPSVLIRKETLISNAIEYDTKMEPAEDYDLWVRLLGIGRLHNLQDCLLKYRVHDMQVSNLSKIRQDEAMYKIRIKLLMYLAELSSEQKRVYLKMILNVKTLSFHDFLIFLSLKSALIEANKNNFFDKQGFVSYWSGLENSFVSFYFKNRTDYSFLHSKQYLSIHSQLNNKLDAKNFIKLALKSIFNYKVK
ncbi:MAG: glycosyltransferase [Flavobacterium sp.]